MQLGKCHHETTNLRAPMPRPERRRLLATWVPMMMDVVVQLVSWLVFRAPTLMFKLDTLNPFQRTKGSWIMIQKLLRVIFLFAIYPWFVRCNSNNEEVDHISQISNYIITVRGRSNPSKVLKCSANVTEHRSRLKNGLPRCHAYVRDTAWKRLTTWLRKQQKPSLTKAQESL